MILASAKKTGEFFNFNSDQKLLLCLSIHTIGGKMQLIRALFWKMPLIVVEISRNPIKILNQNIFFCSLSPLQLEKIIDENPEKLKLIHTILLGGAPISSVLINKIIQLNLNVFEGFGMTETVSHIALREIQNSNQQKSPFKTLNGITIKENEGRLVVTAAHLELFELLTNDEIEVISDTEFIYLGRTDFVINSGAYKFHPEILEQKLSNIIKSPYFIIGEKNIEFYEIVTLYIEDEYTETKKSFYNNIINDVFEKYEKPKKIIFISKFTYTNSGKINKIQTQKSYFESKK